MPIVDGVSPSSGPASGGTTVMITGSNLSGDPTVDFGTTPGQIISDSITEIIAVSPPITVEAGGTITPGGTVDVTVTTTGGTSATSPLDQFTGIAPPVISSVVGQAVGSSGATGAAAAGPVSGGTEVLIAGTNLNGAITVKFGAVPATIVTDTATYIIADSPKSPAAGPVDITITTPYGTSTPLTADQFTYVAAPSASGASYVANPSADADRGRPRRAGQRH